MSFLNLLMNVTKMLGVYITNTNYTGMRLTLVMVIRNIYMEN